MTKTYVVNSAGLAITRKANPASFDECAQTIYCCNLGHSTVQVTGSSVACFKPGKSSLWQAGFRRIVAASGNGQKLALTLTDRRLVILNQNVEVVASELLPFDVSCLALSPLGLTSFAALGISLLAAAMWSASSIISVYNQDLSEAHQFPIPCADSRELHTPTLVRALSFADLSQIPYLFCALSNGLVVSSALARGSDGHMLTNKAQVVRVGVLPARLKSFGDMLLCQSGCACLIYRKGRTCLFHSGNWSSRIVVPCDAEKTIIGIVCRKEISVGHLIDKYALKTAPSSHSLLDECQHSYQPMDFSAAPCSENPELLQHRWDLAWSASCQDYLLPLEYPLCSSLLCLGVSKATNARLGAFVAVGTAFATGDALELNAGRVIMFRDFESSYIPTRYTAISELDGAVYSIASTYSYLVCTVNHAVKIFQDTGSGDLCLELKASFNGLVAALRVVCHRGLIIVGDILSSVTVLRFDDQGATLAKVAYYNRLSCICSLMNPNDGLFCIKTPLGSLVGRRHVDGDVMYLGLDVGRMINLDRDLTAGYFGLSLLDLLVSTGNGTEHGEDLSSMIPHRLHHGSLSQLLLNLPVPVKADVIAAYQHCDQSHQRAPRRRCSAPSAPN